MAKMSCNYKRGACAVWICVLLTGCGPTGQQKAASIERQRTHCLDRICPGDKEPQRDVANDALLKLNGRWFIGPRRYFSSGMNGAAFYWRDHKPASRGEPLPREHGLASAYSDEETISIFLRSYNFPVAPHGYALIQLAAEKNWIAERRSLRPGLDQIRLKHVIGPDGHYLDNLTYYVATDVTGLDGLPPVAACNHDDARNSGGTGFIWRVGIWADIRMNQKQCADWPEIHEETMWVLSLLREIAE